jgi:ABC-type transport system substrate-binding protein
MNRKLRRLTVGIGLAAIAALSCSGVQAGGTLKLGMTVADIPSSKGAPDQGAEGIRWMGFTVYDSLVYWNLNQSETIPVIVPALAQKFYPNPENNKEWIFELRKDVTFHDGSKFNADAVIWNLDKLFKEDAPQYDLQQRRAVAWRLAGIKTWRKIDDYKVAIGDNVPNSSMPDQVVYVHISSPKRWAEAGGWDAFAKHPSGTGPFKVEEIVPRERAVLVRNDKYWDKDRTPKLDKVILLPMPEASTRTAAILSGQANFIEAPSPDAIPRLKSSGIQIITNPYPHVWPYVLRTVGENTPLKDVRVRKALNLAIDRDAIVQLLQGMAIPAKGHVLPDSPWFGHPSFKIEYNPKKAKELLKEAGYGPDKPLKIKFMISPSGSGQMQPMPMNELVQQQLKKVNVDLSFEVAEWQALRAQRGKGPLDPGAREIHALNNSFGTYDPYSAFERFFSCDLLPPKGLNWSGVCDDEIQALIKKVKETFDTKKQDEILAKIHEHVVDNAYWVWVVHDVNPRALRPEVKGFRQAKSWYQDLTQIYIEK